MFLRPIADNFFSCFRDFCKRKLQTDGDSFVETDEMDARYGWMRTLSLRQGGGKIRKDGVLLLRQLGRDMWKTDGWGLFC